MRRFIGFILIVGVLSYGFLQFYLFLKRRIVVSDVKAITENRLGELIGAKVQVARIAIGFFRHISVSGLRIDRGDSKFPLLVSAEKVVVRYDLDNFIKRDFYFPRNILLDSPEISFEGLRAPKPWLNSLLLSRSNWNRAPYLELKGGEVKLPWPVQGEVLSLHQIRGRAEPGRDRIFRLQFDSRLSGAASGKVNLYGRLNPLDQKTYLTLKLSRIDFSKAAQFPVKDLNGVLEIENGNVRLQNVRFSFRGIPCELEGSIENAFSEKPVIALALRIKEGTVPIDLTFHADFRTQKLSGALQMFGLQHHFDGSLAREKQGVFHSRFRWDDSYEGSGKWNVRKGIYQLVLERGAERFRMSFSLKKFSGALHLQLDHFKWSGFDLATSGRFFFKPDDSAWRAGNRRFSVHFKTDYFIFQYQPLRDFDAAGFVSPGGFNNIVATWGSVSELRGDILFDAMKAEHLTLRTGPVSLAEFRSFGTHPLPRSLDGILEGKLEADGPLERLEFNGSFSVTQGTVGDLEFDRAELHFGGVLPYLILREDSKIWIGRNHFLLRGQLDFKLRNFLQGIEVVNSERVMIWKGLELAREIEGNSKRFSNHSNSADAPSDSLGSAPARIEGEYKVSRRASLRVTAEEDQNKREYLTAGPKVKF